MTATTDWQTVELSRDDHREYATRIKVSHWMENRTVDRRIDMIEPAGCAFIIRQHILVEVSCENDPESNCVGVDLQWTPVGEPRVIFVGEWERGMTMVLAKDYPMDDACAAEALSVMRSLARD